MTDETSQPDEPLEEQLVAYLDGELDAAASRRIEELLARDPRVRQMLHGLERAWDLLEELDAPATDRKLAQSTMEMVALAARRDAEQAAAAAPRRRRRQWLLGLASMLTAAVLGFAAVAAFAPDPNRELLHNLPVLQDLDAYRQVGDIEFLRKLTAKKLFADELPENGGEGRDEFPLAAEQLAQLPPGEKEQLRLQEERYLALDSGEQRQLWQLHQALQDAPDAAQLRQTMGAYYQWVRTLPSYARADLAELTDTADRVKWVARRLQMREGDRRLDAQDVKVLRRWIDEHEEAFIQTLPPAKRKELQKMGAGMRRWALLEEMMPWRGGMTDKLTAVLTDAELAQLRAQLTPRVQKVLADKPASEQWRLLAMWARHALRPQPFGRRPRGTAFGANDDEPLVHFFADELPDQERYRLLNLSGDEMQQELLRLYLQRLRGGERKRP